MSNKPPITPLDQFAGQIVLDVSGGLMAPGGGRPDEGMYDVTITANGIMAGKNGKPPSLTLTLAGIGSRETYEYLNLPLVDANGNAPEKADSYARVLAQAAAAFGNHVDTKDYGVVPVAALAEWFAVGKQGKVYHIPAALSEKPGPDGKRIVLAKDETTFLTPADVAKIETGELKITRRLTPNADPTVVTGGASLGTPAGGQGAPTLGGGQPQQQATPTLGGQQAAPTLGGGAPVNGGGAPTLGGGVPQPSAAPTLASSLTGA